VVARLGTGSGGLAIDTSGLYYGERVGARSVVHRRDHATGADRIVYRAPAGPIITRLEVGGGTLAVELQGGGEQEDVLTRVVALSATGGPASTRASGRYAEFRRRRCGSMVELLDVAPDGVVVFQVVRRNRPCGGRVGGEIAYASPGGRPRVVLRGPSTRRGGALRDVFLGARVGGGGLLAHTALGALVTRPPSAARALPVPGEGPIRSADQDASGRAVVARSGRGGGPSRITVFGSLAAPPMASFPATARFSDVLLCGERVVEVAPFADSPDSPRVTVRAFDGSGARVLPVAADPEAIVVGQACTGGLLTLVSRSGSTGATVVETLSLDP